MKEPGKISLTGQSTEPPGLIPGREDGQELPASAIHQRPGPAVPNSGQNVKPSGFSWNNVAGAVAGVVVCAALFFGKTYLAKQKTPPEELRRRTKDFEDQARRATARSSPTPSGNATLDQLQKMTAQEQLAWMKAHAQSSPDASPAPPTASPNP